MVDSGKAVNGNDKNCGERGGGALDSSEYNGQIDTTRFSVGLF